MALLQRKLALAVMLLSAPVAALAQDNFVPKAGEVRLPADICDFVPVCTNTGDLGLPAETPSLVVPDWGAKRLEEMAEAAVSPKEMMGYAQGISDATVIDWCEVCGCCQIGNSEMTFSQDPDLMATYFKDMVVLQGQ